MNMDEFDKRIADWREMAKQSGCDMEAFDKEVEARKLDAQHIKEAAECYKAQWLSDISKP